MVMSDSSTQTSSKAVGSKDSGSKQTDTTNKFTFPANAVGKWPGKINCWAAENQQNKSV